jgi:hypothetical protein
MVVTQWSPNGGKVGWIELLLRLLKVVEPFAGSLVSSHIAVQVDDAHRLELEGILLRITHGSRRAVKVMVRWTDGVEFCLEIKGILRGIKASGPCPANIRVSDGCGEKETQLNVRDCDDEGGESAG